MIIKWSFCPAVLQRAVSLIILQFIPVVHGYSHDELIEMVQFCLLHK